MNFQDTLGTPRNALLNEIERLEGELRKAVAQKDKCAGLDAGQWRAFFLKTQDQWNEAEAHVMRLDAEVLRLHEERRRTQDHVDSITKWNLEAGQRLVEMGNLFEQKGVTHAVDWKEWIENANTELEKVRVVSRPTCAWPCHCVPAKGHRYCQHHEGLVNEED